MSALLLFALQLPLLEARRPEFLVRGELTVVVIDLHIVEGLEEVLVLNHGGGDVAPHALH